MGERELEVADVHKHLSVDGWKALDPVERRTLFQELINEDNSGNGKKRGEMSATLKTRAALYQQGKRPSSELVLSEVMDIYGADRGYDIYQLDKIKHDIASEVAQARLMPEADFNRFYEKAAHTVADAHLGDSALHSANVFFATIHKAHTDSMKELHQDPVQWGIKNKVIDPIRFDTPESFYRSVAQRSSFVAKTQREHGVASPYFSSNEEKLLKDQLGRRPAKETIQMYQQAYQSTPDGDKDNVLTAFSKIKDNAVSTIAQLSSEHSSDAHVAAHHIIVGVKQ
ncbi:hypothetical protein OROMI_034293 [Orobanche minor]